MALIDFGSGPDTNTGDTVAQAFAKLQARLDALPGALAVSNSKPSIAASAAQGTFLFNITGVPSGVTPAITPNDGRVVVAGDATNGWRGVTGSAALSAGTVPLTVAATGASSASATLTITGTTSAGVTVQGQQVTVGNQPVTAGA